MSRVRTVLVPYINSLLCYGFLHTGWHLMLFMTTLVSKKELPKLTDVSVFCTPQPLAKVLTVRTTPYSH